MVTEAYDTKVPRYIQTYAIIKEWIQKGSYAPGAKLPSEGELCKMIGVSRITTRRSIEMLTNDGLVRRVQGLGTFVAAKIPKTVEPFGDMTNLSERVNRLSERTKLKDIEIERVKANVTALRELRLNEGQYVIRTSYTRMDGKSPIGWTQRYIPDELGIEITVADLERNSSPTLLREKGINIVGTHQLIGSTLSDSKTSTKLRIDVGSPLVRIRLLTLDVNQKPVEYLVAHYRADVYEHHAFLSLSED